jgi:uncharacterized Zn finger protein (UPF0148 family)
MNVRCPECGRVLAAREEHIGRRARCAGCGTSFVIQEPAAAPAPTATADPDALRALVARMKEKTGKEADQALLAALSHAERIHPPDPRVEALAALEAHDALAGALDLLVGIVEREVQQVGAGKSPSDTLVSAVLDALYLGPSHFAPHGGHVGRLEALVEQVRALKPAEDATHDEKLRRYYLPGEWKDKWLARLDVILSDCRKEAADPLRETVARDLGKDPQSLAPEDYAGIQNLDLSRTAIADLTPLANLVNLRELTLAHCRFVCDVSPLAHLGNLRSLNLTGTAVSRILCLAGLRNLRLLDLTDLAGLTARNVRALKVRLPDCHIIGPEGAVVEI